MLWCAASRRLTQPRPPPLGRDRSQTAHGGRRSSTTQVSRATRYHIARNVAGQPAGGLGQCGRRLKAGPQPDDSGRQLFWWCPGDRPGQVASVGVGGELFNDAAVDLSRAAWHQHNLCCAGVVAPNYADGAVSCIRFPTADGAAAAIRPRIAIFSESSGEICRMTSPNPSNRQ